MKIRQPSYVSAFLVLALVMSTGTAWASSDACGEVMPSVKSVGLDNIPNMIIEGFKTGRQSKMIDNRKTFTASLDLTDTSSESCSSCHASPGGSSDMSHANTSDPMALVGRFNRTRESRPDETLIHRVPVIDGVAVVPAGRDTSTLRFVNPMRGIRQNFS